MSTIDISRPKSAPTSNVVCLHPAAKKTQPRRNAKCDDRACAAVTTLKPKGNDRGRAANLAAAKSNRRSQDIASKSTGSRVVEGREIKGPKSKAPGSCESSYFASLASHTLLTADEEKTLATRAKQGDLAARNRMIEANLRLVVKVAKPYANHDVPLLDLISEGNLGLIHAIEKFQPEKGFRFSTYAIWWIRERIQAAVMRQSNIVYMPIHAVKAQRVCLRAQTELRKIKGGEPSVTEVATACEKSTGEVASLLSKVEKITSLDTQADNANARPLSEQLADTHCIDPLITLGTDDMRDALLRSVALLDAVQRQVITRRFGLGGEKPCTLQQLSNELGMCRQTVKKLQDRALKALLKSLRH